MKKYRFTSLFLSLLLVAAALTPVAHAAPAPNITAGAALLMDAEHDEVLYEKNAHQKMYPASLTKVMTSLLVLEAIDAGQLTLDQVVTASSTFSEGLSIYGSSQNIKAGEQLSVRDLLYCLLVASANEAGNILAEQVSGTTTAFVEQMNQRAVELGCEGTHFVNAHGLHHIDHYTTAHDIYLIARTAMENDTFRTIVSTKRYEIPATNLSDARVFYSTNALLVTWHYVESYLYDKAIGIKTGTTDEGGYCLLSAAEDADTYLICVVLNAEIVRTEGAPTDRRQFSESKRLLQWGFDNFKRVEVVDTHTPLAQVAVTLSKIDHVLVRPASQLECTLPVDADLSDIRQEVTLTSETVEAPVTEGQALGSLTLTYEGKTLGTVDLVAVSGAERSVLLYRLTQIKAFFGNPVFKILGIVALGALIIVVVRLMLKRPRRRYKSRRSGSYRRNYTGRRRR